MKALSYISLLCLGLCFFPSSLCAQTIIGGQINSYDSLVSINLGPCGDEILSAGLVNFNVGDLILIYSKAEATAKLSNTPDFGDIQSLNETGHFQFTYITAINGNTLKLGSKLSYNFPTGSQIVKVPVYQQAQVNSSINAANYSGGLGGILSLKADRLIINGELDASVKGFKGGFSTRNMGYSCGSTDYYYPAQDNGGAPKGEGIVPLTAAYSNGRGKIGNGGGGGNNHNAGGGGGANFGAGGRGGNEWGDCSPVAQVGGIGGEGLGIDPNRLFFGGGGGSGHNNLSNTSSEGGDGGGIIIIIADTIEVLSGSISVNGAEGESMRTGAEGSGGGGAGGTILLKYSKVVGILILNAIGGNGGSSTGGPAGPGGGGSGGSILVPDNSAVDYSSGSLGYFFNKGLAGHLSDANDNYGSQNGQIGAILRGAILEIPDPNTFTNQSINILGPDTVICSGDSILLEANIAGVKTWNTGASGDKIYVNSSGTYWLRVDDGACIKTDTINIDVEYMEPVILGNDTAFCKEDRLNFDFSSEPYSILWQDGRTASTRSFNQSGSIWIEYMGQCGLVQDSIQIVAIACDSCSIAFPNAFTPNGDNLNDDFHLKSACDFSNYRLKIFSRWGELIFESNSQEMSWDGTYKGKKAMQGSYVYELYYSLPYKEPKLKHGIVNLIY
tara:strand:+ start:2633 stop:4642 length:2010 start_codon:yes stop_codon:yes gene_type:complete